jgi:hypothetical protein
MSEPWCVAGTSVVWREQRLRQETKAIGLTARKMKGKWWFHRPGVRQRFDELELRSLDDAEGFVATLPERCRREQEVDRRDAEERMSVLEDAAKLAADLRAWNDKLHAEEEALVDSSASLGRSPRNQSETHSVSVRPRLIPTDNRRR